MKSANEDINKALFKGVDWIAVTLYALIVIIGCVCITSATYNPDVDDIFSFSHFYIKQYAWVIVASVAALFILLMESENFHRYAYFLYIAGIAILIFTLLFGREVNGAKSWLEFGSQRLQPVELVKITTSLATARLMSEVEFNMGSFKGLIQAVGILALPLGIIILQNDTGSGIVFGSFIFVMYREGLNRWLCLPALLIIGLFISSFLLSSWALLLIVAIATLAIDTAMSGNIKGHGIYLAGVGLTTLAIIAIGWLFGATLSGYWVSVVVVAATLIYIVPKSLRYGQQQRVIFTGFWLFTAMFLSLTEYIFNNILRLHQQNRIMSFLGIISDPLGIDYNVNQSKIAIGSGGLLGKGFLNSTQVRLGFVPEKHTDFIFCDLSEEWGFVGAATLLILFMALILRLLKMGERQSSIFARVYCYCVASTLLFHCLVNIGMTIGLMPVMGIPLPFVSYGGSSLVAFTLLLFIAIRLDADRLYSAR